MTGDKFAVLLATARNLGRSHGRTGDLAFAPGKGEPDPVGYEPWHPEGYTSYVFWDAGSALLMDALGLHGEAEGDVEWGQRDVLLRAYCEAFASASGTPWDTSS